MFKKARLKLTFVYLGIIMSISIAFSVFIHRMVSFELQRRMISIERRYDLRGRGFLPPPGADLIFIEELKEAQLKVLFILLYTNIVIFILSSLAGYILAGITLRPIEESMEKQKRFIADASHELKTPLTALQTSIEVTLRDKKINLKKALYTLSDSLTDVKKLTLLTNDLLSLTRYQQNGLKESFERVDLKTIITSSVDKIVPIAKKKKVKMIVKTLSSEISGNRESLEKLITIFLDNAIKYTPEEGVVEIKNILKNRYVLIFIKDSGIGIPSKDIPLVFERFYRSDSSRSKMKTTGFGLGLSIAKSIVDIHHGSIDVESEVGKGSTFTIKLPVERNISRNISNG